MNQPDPANLNEPFGDSEQLPPAEAQPDREPADWPHQDWKGMDGATAWLLINRHASGWEAVGEMMDAWLSANAEQPPSAPVGVEEPLSLLRAGHWREVYIGHRCMRLEVTYDYATWERLMEQVDAALAQQPAAAGEEIMVNAAHDVYTLPLQPSGLSSGPRFVVHVPEQPPAAVNEAMVERALAAYLRRQEDGESLYGCVTAALTAALAAQDDVQ